MVENGSNHLTKTQRERREQEGEISGVSKGVLETYAFNRKVIRRKVSRIQLTEDSRVTPDVPGLHLEPTLKLVK